MVKTIGNPLSWSASALSSAGGALSNATDAMASGSLDMPQINRLTLKDLRSALQAGIDDFAHFRSDVLMLVVLYPLIGLALTYLAFNQNLLPLIVPMVAGFALIGPVAAVGLYEMSRRRQQGLRHRWIDAVSIFRPSVSGPVFALGLGLVALYVAWLYAAAIIYQWTLGPTPPASLATFATAVVSTADGWAMVIVGTWVGFLFAAMALITGVISVPMLVDRKVGLPVAVASSMLFARKNPLVTMVWGLIVALSLLIATLPIFLGLVFVLPILGHATWHLYRKAVTFP